MTRRAQSRLQRVLHPKTRIARLAKDNVALAITLLIVVPVAVSIARPVWAASAPRFAPLASQVVDRAVRLRLDEQAAPGTSRRAEVLVPVTQQVIDQDRSFRADVLRQLNDIEGWSGALAPRARVDAAVMRGRLDRWAIERDELQRFRTDPGCFVPPVDDALRSLLAGRPGGLCRRLGPATLRLRAVPEIVRAAKISVAHPSPLAVEFAIARLEQTLLLFRRDMPAALIDCRESGSVASFAVADTLASRAIQQYIDWLRAVALVHADGEWRMGEERFGRWLSATTGDTAGLEALRTRATRELAAMGQDADSLRHVLRADTARTAAADRLLEARAKRLGADSARKLRTVLGRRELALAWAPYGAAVRGQQRDAAIESPRIAPTRLDLVGMLAELDLHAGDASVADARHRFERDAGLDSSAAEHMAQSSAMVPSRAATTITAWQLEALRSEVAQGLTRRFSPEVFLRAVIDAGAVPVVAVREEILLRLHVDPLPAPMGR